MFSTKQSAANIRGDIQTGLSGDKKPGFDPAAAPMETDGEAGGVPLSEEQVRISRESQFHPDPSDHQGTDATAMRRFDRQVSGANHTVVWPLALAVIAALVLVVAAVWMGLA